MTNICNFESPKYDSAYTSHGNDIFEKDGLFFTSLSFQQEPELEEGINPREISQYPLEDILDHFGVWISDFYEEQNKESEDNCFLEFAGNSLQTIISLREIIGKHVFNKTVINGNGVGQILIIE